MYKPSAHINVIPQTNTKKIDFTVGLGQHGLVPAYVIREEVKHHHHPDKRNVFMGNPDAKTIYNHEDFQEFAIPVSFIGSFFKKMRK